MPFPARIPGWRRYLVFWRRSVQADIDDELRFHFDARIAELTALGVSADDARARALEEFGDVDAVAANLRSIDERIVKRQRRLEWLDAIRQDVVYAMRSLRRTPAVTATIIVTLALGLGMNVAMFSFLDQVFARPPAGVADPGMVRRLWFQRRFGDAGTPTFWGGFDYRSFRAVADAVGKDAQVTVAAYRQRLRLARGEGAPEATVVYAGTGYFDVLRVRASAGRLFGDDENRLGGGANVAVVSESFWRSHFHGDRSAVGSTLTLGGAPYTVVGIMGAGFAGVELDATDVWLPIGRFGGNNGSVPWWESPHANGFQITLRLAPGVSERGVEDRITTAIREITQLRDKRVDSTYVARLGSIVEARGPGRPQAEVQVAKRLAGVTVIVLLIACANVINLLLARAVRRRREIAVRIALGISRARLVRLLVVESVLLAMVACAAALITAQWVGTLLRSLLLPGVRWATSTMNWHMLVFALAAAAFAGVLTGLIPALQSANPELTDALKAGAREGTVRRSRLRGALVVVQAALSVVLLTGAALFVKSLRNVHQVDIGFDAEQVLIATYRFEGERDANAGVVLTELAARLPGQPGIERAAATSLRPLFDFGMYAVFPDANAPLAKRTLMTSLAVSNSYFATTGLRIVQGVGFPDVAVGAMPRVLLVNRAMAALLWPGTSALGHCVRLEKEDAPCYTVIGVTENAIRDAVVEDPTPQYYVPIDNMPGKPFVGAIVIRSAPGRSAEAVATARAAMRSALPSGEPRITRLTERLEPQFRPWRLGATLFSAFGLLALVVAAIGIYSSVSYGVNQRVHEFGVRIALGARIVDVLAQVLGEGLRTVAIGVVAGAATALAAGRLIASLLYGIAPNNVSVLLIVGTILLAVATAAAIVPAWRAARVDPATALRAD